MPSSWFHDNNMLLLHPTHNAPPLRIGKQSRTSGNVVNLYVVVDGGVSHHLDWAKSLTTCNDWIFIKLSLHTAG